jgi:hypothetical protein
MAVIHSYRGLLQTSWAYMVTGLDSTFRVEGSSRMECHGLSKGPSLLAVEDVCRLYTEAEEQRRFSLVRGAWGVHAVIRYTVTF